MQIHPGTDAALALGMIHAMIEEDRRLYVGACGLQSDPPAQTAGGAAVSVRGKWRVVETPDHDMAGSGSYILFTNEGGEFALDCLKGAIHGRCEGDAVEFTWDGSDEMEPARGRGWQKSSPMAPLKVRYASNAATTFLLSPADRPLLQQPAKSY